VCVLLRSVRLHTLKFPGYRVNVGMVLLMLLALLMVLVVVWLRFVITLLVRLRGVMCMLVSSSLRLQSFALLLSPWLQRVLLLSVVSALWLLLVWLCVLLLMITVLPGMVLFLCVMVLLCVGVVFFV